MQAKKQRKSIPGAFRTGLSAKVLLKCVLRLVELDFGGVWGSLGSLWGVSWTLLAASWELLGCLGDPFENYWEINKTLRDPVGAHYGSARVWKGAWRPLGVILAASGGFRRCHLQNHNFTGIVIYQWLILLVFGPAIV